jgi:hypothetical protein
LGAAGEGDDAIRRRSLVTVAAQPWILGGGAARVFGNGGFLA